MKVIPAGVLCPVLQMPALAPDLLVSPAALKQLLVVATSQEMEGPWILDWLLLLLLLPQDARELHGECALIPELLQELGEEKRRPHAAFPLAFPDQNTSQSPPEKPQPWPPP